MVRTLKGRNKVGPTWALVRSLGNRPRWHCSSGLENFKKKCYRVQGPHFPV